MPYTPFNPTTGLLNTTPYKTTGQDFVANAYSNVGGGVANQAAISQYEAYKPNELVQLFERHGHGPSFRMMLRACGFTRGSINPTVGHYEAPWKKSLVTFDLIVNPSAGAGTSVTVRLAASNMFDTQLTVGGVAAQGSYPVKGQHVRFKDGVTARIDQKITTGAQHQLVLTPLDTTVDLAASVLVDEPYFLSTNSHAEGSDLPPGRVPRVFKYTNDFQIVKESWGSTGSDLTNLIYWDVLPGMQGPMYMRVQYDALYRFEEQFDGALIWGEQINNVTEFVPFLGHDVPVSGTEGLIRFGLTNGNNDTYTTGAYALDDFTDLARYYKRERIGTKDLCCLQGMEIQNEVQNVLSGELSGDLAALMTKKLLYGPDIFGDGVERKDPNDFALNYGFRAIKRDNFTFFFYSNDVFDESIGAGAAGYDHPGWQLVVPVGYSEDKKNKTTMPTMGYEYKELNGYSREQVIGSFAGVGVAGTTAFTGRASMASDAMQSGVVSEIAYHGTCGNHVSIQRPA